MALPWFNPPVYVKGDRPGMRYGISHVQGAAEELLKWTKRGPRWRRAIEACMAAIEGKVPPKEVRQLFEDAAKEEKVFLPPV
ncbi:hypothetical protein X766_03990 [Mesorhizobium sp. LSJC255A00]|uniref:DUF982 domain-containing protein n=1 Tax=Mesorhizobium sp. LSJC255A00 TaxID=1287313 RepID=UPI0003CDF6AE|nr:DUF982 domain-containing protein [Mesorhizobium sp. LSJC255A00]ESX22138.1 hypothetical protein X766_03990 [Mesorhizobium sp. LSJC255A00]